MLLGCRVERAPALPLVYDALGLPDCAASYDAVAVCDAIEPFVSSAPDDFRDEGATNLRIRWIGTEVEPAYCSDDLDEAEAWVLAREPEEEGGSHFADSRDERWFDFYRKDAEGVAYERQRVVRCAWMTSMSATPPEIDPVEQYARYASVPVEDDDFFPVVREITYWRGATLPVQVVLSWGQVETESRRLSTCNVRCGVCADYGGGRWRQVTGVLERVDWTLDATTGIVSFDVEPLLETDCYARW